MKKIMQTTFGENGNCLCACIASLLEIDINYIPNPKTDDWLDKINDWLIVNHGLYIMHVSLLKGSCLPRAMRDSYIIGVGRSKNNLNHAVICRNGFIVHDPLPDSGLMAKNITEYDIILKFFG